jgi:hypothetical protein
MLKLNPKKDHYSTGELRKEKCKRCYFSYVSLMNQKVILDSFKTPTAGPEQGVKDRSVRWAKSWNPPWRYQAEYSGRHATRPMIKILNHSAIKQIAGGCTDT